MDVYWMFIGCLAPDGPRTSAGWEHGWARPVARGHGLGMARPNPSSGHGFAEHYSVAANKEEVVGSTAQGPSPGKELNCRNLHTLNKVAMHAQDL